MKWFAQPSELFGAVKPIYYASKSLGLTTCQLVQHNNTYRFKFSKPNFVYSCFVFLAFSGRILGGVYAKRMVLFGPPSMLMFLVNFLFGALFLTGPTLSLLTLLKQKQVAEILYRINTLAQDMEGTDDIYKMLFLKMCLYLATGFLTIILPNVMTVIAMAEVSSAYAFLGVSCGLMVTFIIFAISVQFISLAYLLTKFFASVNKEIGLVDSNREDLQISLVNMVRYKKPVFEDPVRVRSLSRLHGQLCDVSCSVNAAYSLRLLIIVFLCIVYITFCLYYFLLQLLGMEPRSSTNLVWLLVTLSWLFWNSVLLGLLVYICSTASDEANKTAVLVHNLLSRTNDAGARHELQLFSLQLLHRKVQFTACGFFPLDFTLLYSIVGAVTTYLVILIQFQLSFGPGSNSNNSSISMRPPSVISS